MVSHLRINLGVLLYRFVNTGDVENIHRVHFSEEDQLKLHVGKRTDILFLVSAFSSFFFFCLLLDISR